MAKKSCTGSGTVTHRKLLLVVIILLFLAGLGILLYPAISEWLMQQIQKNKIDHYKELVQQLDEKACDQMFAEAEAYNEQLVSHDISFENITSGRKTLEKEGLKYENLLDPGDDGIMGYLVIDKIDLMLPISHGWSERVLKFGTGHLEGTSLPVGGENTHVVLFGHRGLPMAKLFTDLDQLEKGDRIELHILNRILVYEVDNILVVEPEQSDHLKRIPEGDYVTLVTCTPYGVNSHRLLIRAVRSE